jgi:hypothetical protein
VPLVVLDIWTWVGLGRLDVMVLKLYGWSNRYLARSSLALDR